MAEEKNLKYSWVFLVDSFTTGPLRNLFALLGAWEPWHRGLVSFVIWVIVLFVLRPRRCFDESGNPLPWDVYEHEHERTTIPWWLEAYLSSVVVTLFV